MNILLSLLFHYKSSNDFLVWNFLPIWKTISSIKYEKYSDNESCVRNNDHTIIKNALECSLLFTITIKKANRCRAYIHNIYGLETRNVIEMEKIDKTYIRYLILRPNERKRLDWNCEGNYSADIKIYKVFRNDDELTQDTLSADIQKFAIDWKFTDTHELHVECSDFYFQSKNFIWTILNTLDMTDLVDKFGICVVQCKAACHFIYDSYYKLFSKEDETHLTQEDDEMRRMGRLYSRFFSYNKRLNQLSIQTSFIERQQAQIRSYIT